MDNDTLVPTSAMTVSPTSTPSTANHTTHTPTSSALTCPPTGRVDEGNFGSRLFIMFFMPLCMYLVHLQMQNLRNNANPTASRKATLIGMGTSIVCMYLLGFLCFFSGTTESIQAFIELAASMYALNEASARKLINATQAARPRVDPDALGQHAFELEAQTSHSVPAVPIAAVATRGGSAQRVTI